MNVSDIVLYNEAFETAIKKIGDCSIDCVVTDPPYKLISGGCKVVKGYKETGGILRKRERKYVSDGTRIGNKWIKKGFDSVPSSVKSGKMFDHNDIKLSEWIPEIYRVLKDGSHCYIMINYLNMQELLNVATANKFKLMNILVWRKNNATPNKYYMKDMEFIVMFRKGFAKNINDMGSKACIEVPNIIGTKVHPSEKPVRLMDILIRNSTQPYDTVLDPFMGSGSTGVACVESDRKFVGIEIDEAFYSIAEKRILNPAPTIF